MLKQPLYEAIRKLQDDLYTASEELLCEKEDRHLEEVLIMSEKLDQLILEYMKSELK